MDDEVVNIVFAQPPECVDQILEFFLDGLKERGISPGQFERYNLFRDLYSEMLTELQEIPTTLAKQAILDYASKRKIKSAVAEFIEESSLIFFAQQALYEINLVKVLNWIKSGNL